MLLFPQSYYVAFFRLCDLEEMPADRLAAAVEFFSQVISNPLSEGAVISNPYGGGIICPTVDEALTVTFEVLSQCGSGIVGGLARGMIYDVRDVTGANYLGHALNRAARLAYLPGMCGKAVASEEFVQDAKEAKDELRQDFFGPPQQGKVKRAELTYHIIEDSTFTHTTNCFLNIPRKQQKSEPMHVLVFDLVKYSERDELTQRTMVETLAQAVKHSHDWLGRGPITKDAEIKYSPAGDGGAIIFSNTLIRSAWTVAEHLQEYSRVHKLALRLGLDSGQMVRRKNAVPLGPAVLGADRAAQSASEGAICFTKRFVDHVPEEDRAYIMSRPNIRQLDEFKDSNSSPSEAGAKPSDSQYLRNLDIFCKELVSYFHNETDQSKEAKVGMKTSVLVLHGSGFSNQIRDSVLRYLRDAEIDSVCPSLNASPYSYIACIENSISAVTHVLYLASRGENIHKGWAPLAHSLSKEKNKAWVPRSMDFQS